MIENDQFSCFEISFFTSFLLEKNEFYKYYGNVFGPTLPLVNCPILKYNCSVLQMFPLQVSTTPHMEHRMYLGVIQPKTIVLGPKERYIEKGSTINLTCIIQVTCFEIITT